jgi:uncharacterized protein (DUF924 family)
MMPPMHWNEIIHFWLVECRPEQWFQKDDAFDGIIRDRFLATYWRVVKGETEDWRNDPRGRLAEIVVLDQFARNMFRGKPQAFLYDPLALALAQETVRTDCDRKLSAKERHFAYMPYMHSESPLIHAKALALFEELGDAEALQFEIAHKTIIDRFGRFPHRNAVLGRISTPEEIEFLKTHPGF